MSTIAYLYRWTQKSTGMWYEGSRTKRGCHPDDGYICSSKNVAPMIVENSSDWERQILVIGTPVYIRQLEEVRLKSLDAKNDPMSYNQDNADGNFTTTGTKHRESTKQKMRAKKANGACAGKNNGFYGKKHTAETIEKSTHFGADNGMFGKFGSEHPAYGVERSVETRQLIAVAKTGINHPCNNPKNHKTCEHCGTVCRLPTNYSRWHGNNCKKIKVNE